MAIQRRGHRPSNSDLFPELVDVLLEGWGCEVKPEHLAADAFRIFDLTEDDLREVWQTHRQMLLAEWARRGGDGPPWAQQQFEGVTGE